MSDTAITLEAALEALGHTADDVLDHKVFPDRVVIILKSGPKITWPPVEKPAAEPSASSPSVSDEARRVAAQEGIAIVDVEPRTPGGRIKAKDVRLHKAAEKTGKG